MKNNQFKIAITIFTLLLAIGVYAQGPPGGGQGGGRDQGRGEQKGRPDASEILSKLDTNKDNFIDKEEASNDERGKIAEKFDEIDTNEDELIDLEELENSLNNIKKPRKINPEKLIKQIDDDGNGKLNELEIAAKGKKHLSEKFNEIDANADSELDVEELKFFFEKNDNQKRKRKNKLT